jgi:hypothetical protein
LGAVEFVFFVERGIRVRKVDDGLKRAPKRLFRDAVLVSRPVSCVFIAFEGTTAGLRGDY